VAEEEEEVKVLLGWIGRCLTKELTRQKRRDLDCETGVR
jgi:hypothetical protein